MILEEEYLPYDDDIESLSDDIKSLSDDIESLSDDDDDTDYNPQQDCFWKWVYFGIYVYIGLIVAQKISSKYSEIYQN